MARKNEPTSVLWAVGRWLREVFLGHGVTEHTRLRISLLVTAIGAVLAIAHVLYPTLAIDGITVALVVVALAPWLRHVFKGFQIAGVGVEYHDLERAGEAATAAGLVATPTSKQTDEIPPSAEEDPLLALAALRIALERRLRELAKSHRVDLKGRPGSVRMIARELESAGVITSQQASALEDMAGVLNRAVHAEPVDPRAADWALRIGPSVLASLDSKMR